MLRMLLKGIRLLESEGKWSERMRKGKLQRRFKGVVCADALLELQHGTIYIHYSDQASP